MYQGGHPNAGDRDSGLALQVASFLPLLLVDPIAFRVNRSKNADYSLMTPPS
jgi:hypothetical protein